MNKLEIPEDELRELYLEKKWSRRDIAEYYGCAASTIYRRMSEYSISTRSVSEAIKLVVQKKYNIPEEELYKLYWEKEWSQYKIAKHYGCTVQTVNNKMVEYNIPARSLSEISQKHDISKDELERLYWQEGMTQKEIANKFGCASSTVAYRMKKYGIEARTVYESIGGNKNPNWKGYTINGGYKYIKRPEHPLVQKNGYVAEHRLVYYDTYGEIPDGWHVHHIDDDKLNNDPENLVAVPHNTHSWLHKVSPQVRKALEAEYIMKRDR